MKFTELSLKELQEVSIKAAQNIAKEKNIDLIIYVAKAGFPIAYYMNEVFELPLLGIAAQRKGNNMKSSLGKLMRFVPRFVRDMLIAIELKTKVHNKEVERNVSFHDSLATINKENIHTILMVDDSVDTGHSLNECKKKILEEFPSCTVISYSLNVWEQSKEIFDTDYYSFSDTVIKAPMSKDSKEYDTFVSMYNEKTQEGYL